MKELDISGLIKLPKGLDFSKSKHIENRKFLKKILLTYLIEEEPGLGGGQDTSKYEYIVEYTDIGPIYITRPAHLKKGFDFVINLRNFNFSNGQENPKHKDILNDVKTKISRMSKYQILKLKRAIKQIYLCEDPEYILNRINFSYRHVHNELSIEALLKIIKWMFIEQDIRDWNYSGRKMLFDSIMKLFP